MKNIVGFDCGNSSFRITLGRYNGEKIETQVVEQVPNHMIQINGDYYWDILNIYKGLLDGLKKAANLVDKIDSIGISTWGIDFALFSKERVMINNPYSYRNTFGSEILNAIPEIEKNEMFSETGILCDKINSVFMLTALQNKIGSITKTADKILMIPDILNFFLTGKMINEPSELSTSQMMDSRTKEISSFMCNKFGIKKDLFCSIGNHGELIGLINKEVKDEIGVDYDIPVICVPSHDTAAAVLAIPAKEESFAFISSGTWSLIGTEIDTPIITEKTRRAKLTNEVGAFDKITLLKNGAGMFIIQRLKAECEESLGRDVSWKEIDEMASSKTENIPLFLVQNSNYFNPISMSDEIWNYFKQTNQVTADKDWITLFRSFNESMACSYAETIREIEEVTNNSFDSIYMVGGGSRNSLLCQLSANYSRKNLFLGGKESTSLGTILAQIKYFEKEKTILQLRNIISSELSDKHYEYENIESSDVLDRYKKLIIKGENV